jgi:hypothetical protein
LLPEQDFKSGVIQIDRRRRSPDHDVDGMVPQLQQKLIAGAFVNRHGQAPFHVRLQPPECG